MDNIEYVYTVGMTESDVREHLQSSHTGVLALADDGDAYAVPVSYTYEEGRLFLRLSEDGDSTKRSLVESTGSATFLVFDATGERESWSVLMRGRVRELDPETSSAFDAVALNEAFPPLRVFDEDVADLRVRVCEFEIEQLTARKTA